MKRIYLLLLLISPLFASAQFVPAQQNYGNYNVYGGQWLNKQFFLNRYAHAGTDTILLYVKPTGEVDTMNVGLITAGYSKWEYNGTTLHPLDTSKYIAIGTNATSGTELFRVLNGAVLFDGTVGATPVSGAGTRFMWIPEKSAFRAGIAETTSWDDANIGVSSTAFGQGNIASGQNSYAEGIQVTASGDGSHAEGYLSEASGAYSHAEGSFTKSSAYYSHSQGVQTTASGYCSHAGGASTIASGNYSFIHSYLSDVSGAGSIVLGGQGLHGTKDSAVYVPKLIAKDSVQLLSLSSYSSDITLVQADSTGLLDTIATFDPTVDNFSIIHSDTIYSNGAYTISGTVVLLDDGTFNLPVSSGSGWFKADSSGHQDEAIYIVSWGTDGKVTLTTNSANCKSTDTDGNLCIYDGGSDAILKNRLGTSRKILYSITYYK